MALTQKERFKPKWENLQRLLARGVIPYTVWNFEGKRRCENCGRKDLQDEHYKTADNMKVKTAKMLVAAEQAIIRRGSAQLYILISLIKQRFEALG